MLDQFHVQSTPKKAKMEYKAPDHVMKVSLDLTCQSFGANDWNTHQKVAAAVTECPG